MKLTDQAHERLWRACNGIISSAGARAAMLCDARTGMLLVSVGDAGGEGAVQGVTAIAPGERVVRGVAGHVYGVDLPGGVLLAVLHDEGKLEAVRTASASATREVLAALEEQSRPVPAPQAMLPARKVKAKKVKAKKPRAKKPLSRAAPKPQLTAKKKSAKKKAPAAKARASKKKTKPKRR